MRKKFIGRKQEIEALENLYKADGFQMVTLYGRRRVGKSTLLDKFCEKKKTIFYTAVKSTPQRNLELMTKCVLDVLAPEMKAVSFSTFDDLFSFMSSEFAKERIIFVIDEFPYIAEQDKSLTSVLQKYIDTEWLSGQMFLVISGSSVSFMEEEVMGEKSPLHGRRTKQIKLEPFNYLEAAEFMPSLPAEEKAILYGVTGGVAKYLSLFDENKSLDENIIDNFFTRTGYLYEEPNNLLSQEFRNVPLYSAIIEVIARGSNKVAEIADKTHMDNTVVSHALRTLLQTGIISKEQPITEPNNAKRNQYRLMDGMFKFWYRFIPDASSVIEIGRGKQYYNKAVKPEINQYMGSVFEDICRQYLLMKGASDDWDFFITQAGRWWGSDPEKKEETDIDVVGISTITKDAVIGECKFKNELVGSDVLEALQAKRNLLNKRYTVSQYLLFSKAGFSASLKRGVADNRVRLIDIDELYK